MLLIARKIKKPFLWRGDEEDRKKGKAFQEISAGKALLKKREGEISPKVESKRIESTPKQKRVLGIFREGRREIRRVRTLAFSGLSFQKTGKN